MGSGPSCLFTTCPATPSMEVAEAWNAVLGGARAIEWFDHDFGAGGQYPSGSADLLINCGSCASTELELQARVKNTDSQWQAVAPILIDPFANGYITAETNPHNSVSCGSNGYLGGGSGSANTMVKYDQASNSFYLFAAPCYNGAESVTFTIAGNFSGTVTNDCRPVDGGTNSTGSCSQDLTVSSHQLTINFSDENDVRYVVIPNQ